MTSASHIQSRPSEPEGEWVSRPPRELGSAGAVGRPLIPLHEIGDYVKDHPDAVLSVSSLAALAHLSPHHFARLFKHVTGRTVHQYVLHQRLQLGYRLVASTDLPLSRVATDTGFADESHFIRHFNSAFGLTPGALRKRPR